MSKFAYFSAPNKKMNIPKQSMLNFLKSFQPVECKFSPFEDNIFYDSAPKTDFGSPECKSIIPPEALKKSSDYDSIFKLGELTKERYSYIKENLSLVYGDASLVNNDIKIYHYTEKKIINDFLAIPLLHRMFDEDYFNFEWDMHVGQNFTEHKNSCYRDHFIHQIRDMYSMLVLLGRYGFYEAAKVSMLDLNNGKISKFFNQKLTEYNFKKDGLYVIAKEIYKNVEANTKNVLEKLPILHNLKQKRIVELRVDSEEAYIKNVFCKYVVYATAMLSSLFHDMGYPICHFLSVRQRVSNYNPTMHMFTHNDIGSFDIISSKLSGSLLFTIVSIKEIQKAMMANEKGNYDHGAYSAIAFLMQFYDNGLIFTLPPEKQCAIELAAVAIYNHTRKYYVQNEDIATNYFQPVFHQNPISFMLRLCDDLQEWDRRYFEISTVSDIPFCKKCLLPSIPVSKRGEKEYICRCENNKNYINSSRRVYFRNRKLYLVSTSDFMTSEIIQTNEGKNTLYFSIHYDLYKLLNITRINCTYAEYRAEDLNDIKMLMKNQNFNILSSNALDFEYIYLNYFMSNNPIAIKIKILEKYLIVKFLGVNTDIYISPENLLNQIQKVSAQKICDDLNIERTSVLCRIICNPDNYLFGFYTELLRICVLARCGDKSYENLLNDFYKEYIENSETTIMYRQTINGLVDDCVNLYKKEKVLDENGKIDDVFIQSDDYYNQYSVKDIKKELIRNCVKTYCRADNDFNSYTKFNSKGKYLSNEYIGYYADLYFFEEMNRVVENYYTKVYIT